jgi:hypothetical protein
MESNVGDSDLYQSGFSILTGMLLGRRQKMNEGDGGRRDKETYTGSLVVKRMEGLEDGED